jgi:hypothetical protein
MKPAASTSTSAAPFRSRTARPTTWNTGAGGRGIGIDALKVVWRSEWRQRTGPVFQVLSTTPFPIHPVTPSRSTRPNTRDCRPSTRTGVSSSACPNQRAGRSRDHYPERSAGPRGRHAHRPSVDRYRGRGAARARRDSISNGSRRNFVCIEVHEGAETEPFISKYFADHGYQRIDAYVPHDSGELVLHAQADSASLEFRLLAAGRCTHNERRQIKDRVTFCNQPAPPIHESDVTGHQRADTWRGFR